MAFSTVEVGFVDEDDIGQFEETCLFRLDAVATCRSFHHHNAVGHRCTSKLGLTRAHGFNQHTVPSTSEEKASHVFNDEGHAAR